MACSVPEEIKGKLGSTHPQPKSDKRFFPIVTRDSHASHDSVMMHTERKKLLMLTTVIANLYVAK